MTKSHRPDADLRDEYDFASMKGSVRGKYYRRIREQGTNVVLLDPQAQDKVRKTARAARG